MIRGKSLAIERELTGISGDILDNDDDGSNGNGITELNLCMYGDSWTRETVLKKLFFAWLM